MEIGLSNMDVGFMTSAVNSGMNNERGKSKKRAAAIHDRCRKSLYAGMNKPAKNDPPFAFLPCNTYFYWLLCRRLATTIRLYRPRWVG